MTATSPNKLSFLNMYWGIIAATAAEITRVQVIFFVSDWF